MPKRSRTRPADVNSLAASIVEEATGGKPLKDPAAVALGRKGGKKGGVERAKRMTAEQKKEAAQTAARARWHPKG